jgi:hypothetical protein
MIHHKNPCKRYPNASVLHEGQMFLEYEITEQQTRKRVEHQKDIGIDTKLLFVQKHKYRKYDLHKVQQVHRDHPWTHECLPERVRGTYFLNNCISYRDGESRKKNKYELK